MICNGFGFRVISGVNVLLIIFNFYQFKFIVGDFISDIVFNGMREEKINKNKLGNLFCFEIFLFF